MSFVLTLSTIHYQIYNLLEIFFELAVFFVQFADDVRDAYTQNLNKKSKQKAIVNDLHRAGTDRLTNNKWMTVDQWARYIKDDLPLSGNVHSLPLEGADICLASANIDLRTNCPVKKN